MTTASNTLTYDDATPHRPGLAELGGGIKENHPAAARAPGPKQLRAEEFNQLSKQTEAFGRVVDLAKVTVKFTAGVPAVNNVKALGALVAIGDFTVIENGTGDTTLWWTTGVGGKMPATSGGPVVSQCDDTDIDKLRAFYTTVTISSVTYPAVRVKSFLGAAAADCDFVVCLG